MDIEDWRAHTPFPRVKGFLIAVRKSDDIRILSRPPWWTPERLLAVIGGLMAALAGIFAWNRSLNRLAERRGKDLTQRQKDILASLVRGLTNSDIAKQFTIRESSVKEHLTAIFAKLGAANRSEAIAIALRKHLLKL